MFHKLRSLFPEKTSISTVQLNKLKRFEGSNRGPNTYVPSEGRTNMESNKAAFGANSKRHLDTTDPGIIKNPGPNAYNSNGSLLPKDANKQSHIFQAQGKPAMLTGDTSFPGPTSYNGSKYLSIGNNPIQGGSPNNILTLLKAEEKMMKDNMCPFLV